jgi:uncharacterized membrane protein YhiD involved in acid resistance
MILVVLYVVGLLVFGAIFLCFAIHRDTEPDRRIPAGIFGVGFLGAGVACAIDLLGKLTQ